MEFTARQGSTGEPPVTVHQGWATSPLKLQRAYPQADGRCELPLLHTAGGLVGGDQLTLRAHLAPGSQALLTSVAAQKVYGTVGRSRLVPQGQWARQSLHFSLEAGSDLEWLPQELVLFAGGLLEQNLTVELAAGASWLGMDVVRLGRSAAGETLGQGCWRSRLQVCRRGTEGRRWELVDPLEISGASLAAEHGMAGQPVLGSLVWAAPQPLGAAALAQLLADCRSDRQGLEGDLACGALDQGLIARYRGPSSQAARFWFTRLWARIRAARGLSAPELPRVWPFQEQPLGSG
ncbi:MAG: urease accessory protein UreD [Cyanobium sp. D14.bin.5]|nr:urease accessory protein UreD [Cyanobium sp. D14.bin.5]